MFNYKSQIERNRFTVNKTYTKMKRSFTKLDVVLLMSRSTVAIVMFAHGAQKLFGWFGGFGFEGTMQFFTQTIGLPYAVALSVILLESVGMIFLLTGLFTRYLSASVIVIMLGAIFTVHLPNGFFMNWNGSLTGEGFEMHLLLISLAFINTMYGGGKISIEGWVLRKFRKAQINDGMFFI